MAPHHPQLLLVLIFTIKFLAAFANSNNLILIGIIKDAATLQYTTQLHMGSPRLPVNLVLDLGGQSLWLNCPPSSSMSFVRHRSLPCSMAKSGDHERMMTTTTATKRTCGVQLENPVNGAATLGDVAEDFVTLEAGANSMLLFSCVHDYLLKGLATGAIGMLGLGKSTIGFPSQLVHNFDLSRKFTLCLSSSSDGFILAGKGIAKSLTYTPLVRNSKEYSVNVNSIKINGRRMVLGQPIGGVELSTIVPYTTMTSKIYETFTKAFVKAATSMNMTLVTPVAPFGVCFGSQQGVGGMVPDVELVLQSEMVKWRMHSMVRVNDDEGVMCLGVLEGGSDMRSSVVVGCYQLEDHVLEFNLGTSMLGFSSSLLTEGTSCSSIRAMISRPKDAL